MASPPVLSLEESAEVPRKSVTAGDAVACLSLANLCFLRVWSSILNNGGVHAVLIRRFPTPADYLSTMADVALMAGLLLWGVSWARRRSSVWVDRALLLGSALLFAIILNGLGGALQGRLTVSSKDLFLALAATGLLYFGVASRRVAATLRVWRVVLTCLFPFCFVTFGQSLWGTVTYDSRALQDSPPAPLLAHAKTTPRVIWIIFDAWDYRLTFVDRPANLDMPAVDRFRSEFLSAPDARAPREDTIRSMPELITGRRLRNPRVGESETIEEHALYLASLPLRTVPSVFSAAHQRGYNVAVLGWLIPYGRWFPGLLADCEWWAVPMVADSTGTTFIESALRKPISLLEAGRHSPFGQSLTTIRKAAIYFEYMRRAQMTIANPAMGFVFLHVPFPHPPFPYNRFTGGFDAKDTPAEGYANSLALTDRILSQLREQMEKNGTWEQAVVVLSTDHHYLFSGTVDGKTDPRVPFLLKLPGQHTPAVFPNRFNTILTAKLLLNVIDGRIASAEEAGAWLERHRNDAEEPVERNQ